MQIIENSRIKEKIYIEKLNNGIPVVVIPKKTNKKYIIWGIKYGSIDGEFLSNGKKINIPDGSAHYLEHKLFEQENGENSLDVLSSLGVDANAYTTNNHTAYLFECTENFYEGLDELMDYVQNPYFTDENIDKERGIIEQEIMMYKDYPEWELYMNALECMYNSHPIKIDVAGSVESISHITKETLYTIYDNFYTPENSVIVISGDFVPEEIIDVIKSKMIMKSSNNKVERIYPKEDRMIVRTKKEQKMDISTPMFMVGYKDNDFSGNRVKKNLAIEILLNYAYSRSSKIFNDLYEKGKILGEVSFNYEYAENYAHVLIQGQSDDIEYVINALENTLEDIKENGFDFERLESMKRKVYGELVRDNYSTVSSISTGFITDYFRGVSIFDYFEEFDLINEDYLLNLLNELFDSKNKVVSVINPK